jgi:putative metalloprotease
MIALTPLLLAVVTALAMYQFNVWRMGRMLDASSTPLADPRLEPVLAQLARALDLPRLEVHLYEIPAVNGLAAPDGRVFLTQGFYERFRAGDVGAEELASVVAHELGHVALGHAARRRIDFTGGNAIRVALATVLGRAIPGLGVLLANGLASVLAAHLSRQDEYEADAYAAALMTKAGLGTGPQVALLAKLQTMAGIGGGAPAWLASHPPTRDRIAAIRALEAGWRAAGR